MDKIYSNSRLWTFESCPEYFKVKYVDKILPVIPQSINAFLGSLVHESLEWLYENVKQKNKVELDELIYHFVNNWNKNFSFSLKLPNEEKAENYFNLGIKFLANYYEKNKPFSDNTIFIEKKILFPLEENYKITGYIDRLVLNERGEYEVHDYKTNTNLKNQNEIDTDRQLAFYHLGLQEIFGSEIKVKLIWHFLAHNKLIYSERTQEQLNELKKKTFNLIKKIEATTEWFPCDKSWCEWCRYKKEKGISNYHDLRKIENSVNASHSLTKKKEVDATLKKYLIE